MSKAPELQQYYCHLSIMEIWLGVDHLSVSQFLLWFRLRVPREKFFIALRLPLFILRKLLRFNLLVKRNNEK